MNRTPEFRKDPIVDRWVMIAPERGGRPMELSLDRPASRLKICPFCEGNERETPHELFAARRTGTPADAPGWQVRVVPNKFPAARRDADSGYGVHEVIVECPSHETSLTALNDDQTRQVFSVYRDRLRAHGSDKRLRYLQLFKNHGAAAGASVEHAHSQILGVARVPPGVSAELASGERYFQQHGNCIFCDLIRRELSDRERLVYAGDHCVAFTAYAGRFPYETWVLPRAHASRFEDCSDAVLHESARMILAVLRRLEELVARPPYNLVLHTAPLHDGPRPDYHWHWEILPRLTGIAGFELGTGSFLNPAPPEHAAGQLRGD